MNIVLFETNIHHDIKEICLNKFIHEITIGIYNNEERVQELNYSYRILCPRLKQYPYSILYPKYKDIIFENSRKKNPTIFWNSSFIFNENIALNLKDGECLITVNGTWVAYKSNQLTQKQVDLLYQEDIAFLSSSKILTSEENVISLRSYEDVIKGIQLCIDNDIDLYIEKHPELEEIQENVFVHPSSNIRNPVDFDTEQGKIIIESNTKITAFTLIEGPSFIGSNCLLTKAYIRPKTAIGNYCRVAGELSLSTFCSYSNKSHDGCVALSYIGSWVNLGAGTECATLKYTYTPLSFYISGSKITTQMIGCGTIFTDWVSTGVGTVLSPATIIGLGSTIHEPYQQISKYVKPFSWNNGFWRSYKWLETAVIKMKRRDLELSPYEISFYKALLEFFTDL